MSSWRALLNSGSLEVPPPISLSCLRELVTQASACFCAGAGALPGWCVFFKLVFNCQFPVKACFFSSCLKAFACLPLFGWLNLKANTAYSERLHAV